MKSRQELRRPLADAPAERIEYACQLQDQLAEARAYLAQLKQQLFGPKADKLTPQQEEQLQQLTAEAQEQAQRPPPLSQEVLEAEAPLNDKEKPKRRGCRQSSGVSPRSAFKMISSMTVGVAMSSQAGNRRRTVSSASTTSSSSFARSRRTLLSTAMSGFLLTPFGIDHLQAPMQQPLAFLVGEGVRHRARLFGQPCPD
jgi:hypothetical protein